MADDGQLTPEKQLLKLIQESKATPGAAPSGPGAETPAGGGKSQSKATAAPETISWPALRGMLLGRWSFFKRFADKKLDSLAASSLSLSVVNKILTVAVACLFVYVIGDALASTITLQRSVNFAFQKGEAVPPPPKTASLLSSADYYLQKLTLRDLFREAHAPEVKTSKKSFSVENDPATSKLKLVGISWSATPDAIIEDEGKPKTYFVRRGQELETGVRVESIYKDHVVLSYRGQEFELR